MIINCSDRISKKLFKAQTVLLSTGPLVECRGQCLLSTGGPIADHSKTLHSWVLNDPSTPYEYSPKACLVQA